jgi:medium-chain acyl-[acyl-carrier-protein] hydrolase
MTDISDPNRWFPQSTNRNARGRLFCFPHAGGGAAKFYSWSHDIPAEIELLPVKLPGREERFREPAVDSLPALVERLAEVLPARCDLPFAFLGHSMGALIAFELARRLHRMGKAGPVCLFVAACPAPQAASFSEAIHTLPDAELLRALRTRYGGIPDAVAAHAELMQLMLPVLRADFKAVETYAYRPEPPLACGIVAMAGDEDAEVGVAEVSAWREQTNGGFSLHILRGNHFFLHEARQSTAQLVSRHLQALLAAE